MKAAASHQVTPTALRPLRDFGANPGNLEARLHAPEGLQPGAALVVALHGCTQTADLFDLGAGWSTLADRHGFALLCPQQQASNNAHLCFNWFEPGDTRRGAGEAGSIRQMIEHVLTLHDIDRSRIFITGLSAGGAMAATMLAVHPELFSGGAIIAGLPHGIASGVPQALERMRGQGLPPSAALADLVRKATGHEGPWPRLQVWHGTADAVVVPANGEALLAQWRPLHGLPAAAHRQEAIGPHLRRIWTDGSGRPVLEHYAIRGLGHGVPLDSTGPDGIGSPGSHMLEVGISSTLRIAEGWGLLGGSGPRKAKDRPSEEGGAQAEGVGFAPGKVGQAIESALRAAGLMR